MVQDNEGAEAFASLEPHIEEAVDHRQAVALLVREAGADQPAIDRRLAIFDDERADRRLLDHVREVALIHLGHAAARVTRGEVTAKETVLLVRSPWLASGDFKLRMPAQQLALRGAGLELGGQDPHRDAGRAVDAARPVGNGLTAAEPDPPQSLVQLARMAAAELSEYLPLDLARQVRTRVRVRHEELGKAKWCAHPRPLSWLAGSLCGW